MLVHIPSLASTSSWNPMSCTQPRILQSSNAGRSMLQSNYSSHPTQVDTNEASLTTHRLRPKDRLLPDSRVSLQLWPHGAEQRALLRPDRSSLSTTLLCPTHSPLSNLRRQLSSLLALRHRLHPAARPTWGTRSTAHTGSATANAITCSRDAVSNTRCQTRLLSRGSGSGQFLAGGRRGRRSGSVRVLSRPWARR